jgi:hypothetical protein
MYSSCSAGDAPEARTPSCRASQGWGLAAICSPAGAGPVVERGRQLGGHRGSAGGCALRAGEVVPQVGQGEPLEAAVKHAGDGPGAVHRRGGDPVDEGIDVVAGELGGA